LHVVLEQHAVVPVVVGVGEAAIDLRGRENEAAPLAERDDLFELELLSHGRQRNRGLACGARRRRPLPSCLPMPIYEYRCTNGHTFEVIQSMSDDPVETCEVCGAPVERVFHPIAVHFKGSGFYSTDYKNQSKASSSNDGDSSSSDSSSDSSS